MKRVARITKAELRRIAVVALETGMRVVIRPDHSIVLERPSQHEVKGEGCDGGSPDREIMF